MKSKTLLLTGLLVALSWRLASQQVITMNEEDIDLKIVTWHYSYYEKSLIKSWALIPIEGIAYYRADFVFQSNMYSTYYDDAGFILFETVNYAVENLPEPVKQILDYRVVKYKVTSFEKYQVFEAKSAISTFYKVDLRTKTGGQIVYWFDKDYKITEEQKYEFPYLVSSGG